LVGGERRNWAQQKKKSWKKLQPREKSRGFQRQCDKKQLRMRNSQRGRGEERKKKKQEKRVKWGSNKRKWGGSVRKDWRLLGWGGLAKRRVDVAGRRTISKNGGEERLKRRTGSSLRGDVGGGGETGQKWGGGVCRGQKTTARRQLLRGRVSSYYDHTKKRNRGPGSDGDSRVGKTAENFGQAGQKQLPRDHKSPRQGG